MYFNTLSKDSTLSIVFKKLLLINEVLIQASTNSNALLASKLFDI